MFLTDLLRQAAARNPFGVAVAYEGGRRSWREFAADVARAAPLASARPDPLAGICYTGGTTGSPRA